MDTPELRRSVLERKDRDELMSIAKSLEAKPGSRARKAEIIDLILETVTVSTTQDSADTPSEQDGQSPEQTPAKDAEPAKAKSRARTSAKGKKSSDAAGKSSTNGSKSSKSEGREDASKTAEGEPMTYHAGDDEFDFGSVTTKGENGRTGDEPERGNRRGRRRGRGRDRDRDDQVEPDPVPVEGSLDLRDDGYGFLRVSGVRPSKQDAYVSVKQVRTLGLRKGDRLVGTSRPATRNEKNPAMVSIDSVNGQDPEHASGRPDFDDLTPLFPDEWLQLETPNDPTNVTGRIIDLVAPVGRGQRGLIVAPPKAGKTMIMKSIAKSIEANHADVKVLVLLVDERPEEVTDLKRSLSDDVEVYASTFDRPPEEHIAVSDMTIERAKRLVESGQDVVVILDGITRLARAHNLAAPGNGRVMSGGMDAGAIYPPKKLFGAARNVEEGGSLTILATALVETGSKMDDVIFEEFKGTGNMELRLDRKAAERRIFPAIDVAASSTRREELIFGRNQRAQSWKLRNVLLGMGGDGDHKSVAGLELLIDRLQTFKTNAEFIKEIQKTA